MADCMINLRDHVLDRMRNSNRLDIGSKGGGGGGGGVVEAAERYSWSHRHQKNFLKKLDEFGDEKWVGDLIFEAKVSDLIS